MLSENIKKDYLYYSSKLLQQAIQQQPQKNLTETDVRMILYAVASDLTSHKIKNKNL